MALQPVNLYGHVMVHQSSGEIEAHQYLTWMKCERCGVVLSPNSGKFYTVSPHNVLNPAVSTRLLCDEVVVQDVLES